MKFYVLWAAIGSICSHNAAYRRTLNEVRSTGKKTPIFAYAPQNATVPSEGTHPVGEGACRSTTFYWIVQTFYKVFCFLRHFLVDFCQNSSRIWCYLHFSCLYRTHSVCVRLCVLCEHGVGGLWDFCFDCLCRTIEQYYE